jgi:hypothetical protein
MSDHRAARCAPNLLSLYAWAMAAAVAFIVLVIFGVLPPIGR